MAPAGRKRARPTPSDEAQPPSTLLSDNRAQWLVKCVTPYAFAAVPAAGHQGRQASLTQPPPSSRSEYQTVELQVKNETQCESLVAHRNVLTQASEYFDRCLKEPWSESKGVITFDDIDPKFLALYIGVAYAHSSLIPLTAPQSIASPEAANARTSLRDLVEVYKLCDRFVSPTLTDYIARCIDTAIGDGHRALFRAQSDEKLQLNRITDFADGYEALEMMHAKQKAMGSTMILYFCEGVSHAA